MSWRDELTQVLQDIRAIVLYPDLAPNKITANEALSSSFGRLAPIAIVVVTFVIGLRFFRSQEPWFAERA